MGLPTQTLGALPEVPKVSTDEPHKPAEPQRKKPVGEYIGPRVTERNALRLWFLWKFPGADVEACSVVVDREDKPFAQSGLMPTIKGTEKILHKLRSLGVVGKYANPSTKRAVYALTEAGMASAYSFGYDLPESSTIEDKAPSRANHYQMIAHVAAQFASPKGFFRDSLGIEPVGIEGVMGENEMRAAYEPVKEKLKAKSEKGEPGDFGEWRLATMKYALEMAKQGRLDWSDIVEWNPALLTIGQPDVEEALTKPVHQPDLAVILDGDRNGIEARNLLVEVEINKKSKERYAEILHTYATELKHGFVYSKVVYFTINSQVETLLRKVDKFHKLGLFDAGLIQVLPILHSDGTPVRLEKRITIKEK